MRQPSVVAATGVDDSGGVVSVHLAGDDVLDVVEDFAVEAEDLVSRCT